MSICDNICLALENTFSLTLLDGVCSAGQSFPPRYRTAITKRGGAAPGLYRSYACHRVDHPSCPHRRRPHSCTAFPLCSVRRCPDSICDKLTRQGTMQTSARPVYPRSWARLSPSAQPVYPQSLLLEAAQYLLKLSSLPSSRLRRLPLCQLYRKARSPPRLP